MTATYRETLKSVAVYPEELLFTTHNYTSPSDMPQEKWQYQNSHYKMQTIQGSSLNDKEILMQCTYYPTVFVIM
jgi:hypothetical protein